MEHPPPYCSQHVLQILESEAQEALILHNYKSCPSDRVLAVLHSLKRHERSQYCYCDWRDLLTAKETIILAIQGGNITVIEIATKLSELGVHFKPAENEIRARLSELRKDGLVYEEWRGGQVWQLSGEGTLKAADITPQLRDDELELFAGLSKRKPAGQ